MRWRLPEPMRCGHEAADPAADGCVALVLPAHDEAATVASVVTRAPASVAGRPVEVIVVDDGSTDATAAEARRAGAQVVSHPHRRGLGAAIRTGLAAAVTRGAAVVAFCDADGEYAPEELDVMVRPILTGDADYVVGSRFAGHIEHMLRRRRLGNRVLTGLLRWVSRVPLTDGQSGFRALSRAAARAATIEHDFNYAQVLTLDLVSQGFRYAEVPISYRFRQSGRSFVRLVPYLCAVLPAMWRVVQRAPLPDPATTELVASARRDPRRWLGVGAAAIAAGFATLTLVQEWSVVRAALGDARPVPLVVALGLAMAGMTALAMPWRSAARAIGAPALTAAQWRRAYFTGELGKYVPGGIWPVVGRAEQARRLGVPAPVAYASVPLSLGYAYLAAAFVLAAAASAALAAGAHLGKVAWTLAVIPVGLAVLHPAVLGRAVRLAERILRRPLGIDAPPWSRSLGLTARYVPAWLLIGAATVTVGHAFVPGADPVVLFVAAVASWLAGFLMLPAPGGLGVREATFAAVAPVPFGVAFTIAATARLVFVLVDITAFAVAATTRRNVASVPAASQPIEQAAAAASVGSVLHDVTAEPVPRRPPALTVERAIGA